MRFPLYVILNAGFLNILTLLSFVFAISITGKKASIFNNVVGSILSDTYALVTLSTFIILVIGLFGVSLRKGRFMKKVLWTSAFSPILLSSYYLLLIVFTGQKLFVAIFSGIFISLINYLVAKPLLQK